MKIYRIIQEEKIVMLISGMSWEIRYIKRNH